MLFADEDEMEEEILVKAQYVEEEEERAPDIN